MKGVIIVNQEVGHNRYKIDRLTDEFAKENVEIAVLVNDGTLAKIENNNVNLNFEADFVIYPEEDERSYDMLLNFIKKHASHPIVVNKKDEGKGDL